MWPLGCSPGSLIYAVRLSAAAGMLLVALVLPSPAVAVKVTEYPVPSGGQPHDITAGPDGNLWFTEMAGNRIGRITPAGRVDDFSTGSGISNDSDPHGITAGPDGAIWFAETSKTRIGRMTISPPQATAFTAGILANAHPWDVTAGPDGNVWFTEGDGNRIGRITPTGTVTEFALGPPSGNSLRDIAVGADGNLWFDEYYDARIGRITPQGVYTQFSSSNLHGGPWSMAAGPDDAMWFTEPLDHRLGRISFTGDVTEYSLGANVVAQYIVAGPDGNLWFTTSSPSGVGRITPAGTITLYGAEVGITANSGPQGITVGPDGNIWFAEADNRIGKLALELPPSATTGPAGAITSDSASLTGSVNPLGAPTGYAFEYGRTTNYGSSTATRELAAGGKTVDVQLPAAGLEPNATYHYRLVATNAFGSTRGADRTFTTVPGPRPTTTAPQDRTAPVMRVLTHRAHLRRLRYVKIRLACPLSEALGCTGSLGLRVGVAPRQTSGTPHALVLGRARFRIGGGQTKAIKVVLSRSGSALVLSRRRVPAAAVITASDSARNSRTRSARILLVR